MLFREAKGDLKKTHLAGFHLDHTFSMQLELHSWGLTWRSLASNLYVVKVDLEPLILLFSSSKGWDYQCLPLYLTAHKLWLNNLLDFFLLLTWLLLETVHVLMTSFTLINAMNETIYRRKGLSDLWFQRCKSSSCQEGVAASISINRAWSWELIFQPPASIKENKL